MGAVPAPGRRRAGLWSLLLPLLLILGGCQDELIPIPGTTTRVKRPELAKDKELQMEIFVEPDQCTQASVPDDERHLCLPHVDRASGEVRLGFRLKDGNVTYDLPRFKEQLKVIHQGTSIVDGSGAMQYVVVPHDPELEKGTLYVLVIDGSGSMKLTNRDGGPTRMQQVKQALQLDSVVSAFFPDGQAGKNNAVLLMQFTEGEPQPVGGSLTLLNNRREYKKAVRKLRPLGGFTHLYDAVAYASGPLLQTETVNSAVDDRGMGITVVVLTDGFNNLKASDTCADNAPRLEQLLGQLRMARSGEGVDLRRRPTVHTVGLGKPFRRKNKELNAKTVAVRPEVLCGAKYKDRRIDGDLELRGIDKTSLDLIARAGGGSSYVRRGREGLGEAFRGTAALRYRWFEVRYRTDAHYLRRMFTTQLELTGIATAGASIDIHPSAWLDAPPGVADKDGWHLAQSYRHTLTRVMPLLGLLVSLSFLGAAAFNLGRMLRGRLRPKAMPRQVAASAAPPPTDPPPPSA